MESLPVEVDHSVPGMRIEVYDAASLIRARVLSARARPDWTPFVTDPTRDESRQVAMTLEHREVLYAIAESRAGVSDWQYDLIPWPPGEIVRRKITLSREFFEAIEAEKRRQEEERRRNRRIRSRSFLIALLPARLQEHFGEEYGYDATRWVKISSVVIGLIAGIYAVALNIEMVMAGGNPPAAVIYICFVMFYLVLDSLCRFVMAIGGQHTVGLLALELGYAIVRALRRPK